MIPFDSSYGTECIALPLKPIHHICGFVTDQSGEHTTEVFADVEYATGGGIGSAFGVAGYTNLDSVRTVEGVPLSQAPYLARPILPQIISLGDERIQVDRDPAGIRLFCKWKVTTLFEQSELRTLEWPDTSDRRGATFVSKRPVMTRVGKRNLGSLGVKSKRTKSCVTASLTSQLNLSDESEDAKPKQENGWRFGNV